MKPAGRYRKGYRNEKRSRALLEAAGYLVIEARGSHGLWDLVAVAATPDASGTVVLVQVKSNRPPSLGEMRALRDFPSPVGGWKEVHVWKDRAKEPDVITI